MKKINNLMMLAAAAAALFSCAKVAEAIQEEPKQEEPKQEEVKGIPVTIKGALTKTELDEGVLYWSAGDDVYVMSDVDDPVKFTSTDLATERQTQAEFKGTVAHEGMHFAVFCKSDDFGWDGTDLQMSMPAQQTIPATGTFDPKADILLSQPFLVSAEPDQVVNPAFARFTSFFKVTPKGTLGYKIDKVTITASQPIAGLITYGYEDNTMVFLVESNSVEVTDGTYNLTDDGSKSTYVGIVPCTLAAGETLTIEIEAEGHHWIANKVLAADLELKPGHVRPINLTLTEANEAHPKLVRQWGWYSGENLWTKSVTAISITHPDVYGMARGLAMDDDYIYLPKSSAYAAIAGVSITNPATQVKGSVSGVDVGSTFKSSFVRTIKNTDPSVNGGKDVLLMSNLTNTDAGNLVIYAYNNGIENAPLKLAQFAWDSANNIEDWRRYGDRFFVTGTWQDGKIYLPSFNANKIVVLSVANGARTAVTQIAAGAVNSPDGIKDLTVYPGDNKLFLTNGSIANLVAPTGGKANGWDEYTLSEASPNGIGTYGYNFFSFKGKNYIAYARISGNKAWVEVIEDLGDLVSSLAAQKGLLKSPIHSATDLNAEHATGGLADCCVRVIGGEVFIAALTRDGGLIVDKLVLD